MALSTKSEIARIGAFLAGVNLSLVKAAQATRRAQGRNASTGGPQGDHARLVAPQALKAAPRTPPRALSGLSADDPRLRVAYLLRDAFGRPEGRNGLGVDSKQEMSKGPRLDDPAHPSQVRMIEFLANGWPVDRAHGPTKTWRTPAPAIALPVQRQRGARKEILAFEAICFVCVDNADLGAILRAHGWSVQDFNRARLRDAILDTLDQIACALGLRAGGGG